MTQITLFPMPLVAKADEHRRAARPPRYHWYASRYLCAITLACVLILAVRHYVRTRLRNRRFVFCDMRDPKQETHCLWGLIPVVHKTFQTLSLTTMPDWLYGPDTVADAICSASYCGLLMFFALNHTSWVNGTQNTANQMGVMAFSQLPLILVLIMKNNPISYLTGITYQKLNYLHRAASRACLLCSWIHVILWTPRVWASGHFSHAYIVWGLIALFGYTMLWTTSLRIVRRVAWEFFIVAHVLFTLMFMVAAVFHWARLSYWVWPSLGIWLCDRLCRWWTKIQQNGEVRQAAVELLDTETMRLTVDCGSLQWQAGQHAFLSFPGIQSSPHESHPFSFGDIPGATNTATFVVKVHSGVTKRLYDSIASMDSERVATKIEGPYGSVHDLGYASSVLLIAGGSGVTFCLSHLVALSSVTPNAPPRPRLLHLVWHVRQAHDVSWILPILNRVSAGMTGRRDAQLKIRIDIFVTRMASSRLGGFAATDQLCTELHPAIRSVIHWHHGRANFQDEIADLLAHSTGDTAVAVCGPHSLIRAARKAARSVPPAAVSKFYFLSETLGS